MRMAKLTVLSYEFQLKYKHIIARVATIRQRKQKRETEQETTTNIIRMKDLQEIMRYKYKYF